MRIGILTLPLHTNYGGILQAYALQTVLERMGHEVVIISRNFKLKKYPPLWRFPLSITKRCIRKYLLRQDVDVFSEYHQNKTYKTISQHTQKFINQYIHSLTVNKLEELNEKDFDCIIVGSDQVWRKKYFTYHYATTIDKAYLSFAKDWNVKKIAYAASFGTNIWEYTNEETNSCKTLLKQFDCVSVREDSGVHFCNSLFNKEARWVLDPTMLLTRNDYLQLLEHNSYKTGNNLACYVLDEKPQITALIESLSKRLQLSISRINSDVDNYKLPATQRIQPPVENWIFSIMQARFVITDSFHACVFCIIFHKPFVVVGNRNRGYSRFESLLSLFNLQNRLLEINSPLDESVLVPLSEDTDGRLQTYRKISMDYLDEALKL